jgi:hypothetical protein
LEKIFLWVELLDDIFVQRGVGVADPAACLLYLGDLVVKGDTHLSDSCCSSWAIFLSLVASDGCLVNFPKVEKMLGDLGPRLRLGTAEGAVLGEFISVR